MRLDCCQRHRKRESQHDVNGWRAVRSRLHCRLRLVRHTTTDRTATRPKSDQRRDEALLSALSGALLSSPLKGQTIPFTTGVYYSWRVGSAIGRMVCRPSSGSIAKRHGETKSAKEKSSWLYRSQPTKCRA